MSRLFVELYLDEDVHVLVADLIQARGFQAITTRDAGQLQNSDPEQLAQEYFNQDKKHYGIIFAVRHSPQEIARRLSIILNNVTADEMENQVRYI